MNLKPVLWPLGSVSYYLLTVSTHCFLKAASLKMSPTFSAAATTTIIITFPTCPGDILNDLILGLDYSLRVNLNMQ